MFLRDLRSRGNLTVATAKRRPAAAANASENCTGVGASRTHCRSRHRRSRQVGDVAYRLDLPTLLNQAIGFAVRENAAGEAAELCFKSGIAHWPRLAADRMLDEFLEHATVVQTDRDA